MTTKGARGFFGKYGPLNPAPAREVSRDGVRWTFPGDIPSLASGVRRALVEKAAGWGRSDLVGDPPPATEVVMGLPLAQRLAVLLAEHLRALEHNLDHDPGEAAEAAFWVGILAQRLYLAPRESWRRLSPRERQQEGPRLAQRKRWKAHGAEVDEWRAEARAAWELAPLRSGSDVAREIAGRHSAPWETVRRRIRDLRPPRGTGQ